MDKIDNVLIIAGSEEVLADIRAKITGVDGIDFSKLIPDPAAGAEEAGDPFTAGDMRYAAWGSPRNPECCDGGEIVNGMMRFEILTNTSEPKKYIAALGKLAASSGCRMEWLVFDGREPVTGSKMYVRQHGDKRVKRAEIDNWAAFYSEFENSPCANISFVMNSTREDILLEAAKGTEDAFPAETVRKAKHGALVRMSPEYWHDTYHKDAVASITDKKSAVAYLMELAESGKRNDIIDTVCTIAMQKKNKKKARAMTAKA